MLFITMRNIFHVLSRPSFIHQLIEMYVTGHLSKPREHDANHSVVAINIHHQSEN